MRKRSLLLFCLLGLAAATVWGAIGDPAADENATLTLIVGETMTIPVDGLAKIGVAEPKIADIVTYTTDSAVIIGKAQGRTTFFYTDKKGDHSMTLRVVPEDINYLTRRVEAILKDIKLNDVYTRPVEDQGKVMLLGSVRTAEEKERIKIGLGELYAKTLDMVQIEEASLVEVAVEVVELNKGATNELGFTVPRTITIEDTPPAASTKWAEFFKVGALARSDSLSWKLDMLENDGKAKILARPRVVCQSGKEADFLVGGEVPVFTTSVASTTGSTGTEVEYKEYGIKLNISPVVTASKRIEMGLKFQISELGESDTIGAANAPTAKAYPIKTRDVSTSLHMESGETLAIGGLIKQKSSEDLAKFPWLADVPVLGTFFRHKTNTTGGGASAKDDTELFITLTPRIIYSSKDESAKKEEAIKVKENEFVSAYARTDIPRELQDYVLSVQKLILDNVRYPSSLLGTGWEGDAALKIIIARDGSLKEAQMLKSSGYNIFDEDALKLVKDLKYPPFDFDSSLEEVRIEVPIAYREKK